MPPKAAKKGDEPPPIVQRPSTANDHAIAATVRQLQGLVNTEVKWRNRVSSAKHLSQVSQLKIQKLRNLIAVCDDGCKSLNSQLSDLFTALQETGIANTPVNVSSAGVVTRAGAIAMPLTSPAAPTKGAPPPKNPQLSGALPTDEGMSADALQRRKDVLEHLFQFLRVMYHQPRMARERTPHRPQNALEMQREFDLATKLALQNAPQQTEPAAGAAGKGKAPPAGGALRPPKAPKPSETTSAGGSDPYLGELPPADFFVLPLPKGVDANVMQFVYLLRSKRLRLEHCKALFIHELEPLTKRICCNTSVGVVGGYGLEAVAPLIRDATALELTLQKTRQAEDQAFLQKRAQSVPPATSKK